MMSGKSLPDGPLFSRSIARGVWLGIALGILVLAAFLRLTALHDVPPGLSQDEVLNADIVGFIRGGEHAFFFRHGFGHEPLYHYFSVPFQVLLGDNVLSIRLPAAFLGILLVALTLRWVRRDFGDAAALLSGAGLAVSWWAIVFSRVGIRPIMEPVFLVAAALAWPFAVGYFSRKNWLRVLAAGLLLGLSLYTYTAARVLFALPAVYLIYNLVMALLAARRENAREVVIAEEVPQDLSNARPAQLYRAQSWFALVALVVMVAVYLPLFVTLQQQPELQQRVEQLGGPLTALADGDWQPVLSTTAATLGFFGLTGDPRWTYGLPDVSIFGPVLAILFVAGLLVAIYHWRQPVILFVLIWLAVTLIPSAVTPDAPSSVRLIGALPVAFLIVALPLAAIDSWMTRRRSPVKSVRTALFVAGMFLLVGFHGGRSIRNGFLIWPAELETRLRYQTTLLDSARLIEESQTTRGDIVVLADGFVEPIDDASLRRNLAAPLQTRWIQSGAGVAGALVWPNTAGDQQGPTRLYVPEYAPLDPELIAAAGMVSEPQQRTEARPSVAVYALPIRPPMHREPVERAFVSGQEENLVPLVELRGWAKLDGASAAQDVRQLRLLTTWNVLDKVPEDLALFVHLLDEEGLLVAQHDGLDASAFFLAPGDTVLQRHVIDLPSELADGVYHLVAGAYQRQDGRLRTVDGDDWVELAVCRVNTVETVRWEDCLLP